ncbi:MAG TPA: sodium:proton antiporter [Pirellulales bacterium]|nr:sodium:proton antiporter [Pirellulales bacterium]
MSEQVRDGGGSQASVMIALAVVVLVYLGAALAGWPQRGTELIKAAEHASASDEAVEPGHGHAGAGSEKAALPTAVPMCPPPAYWTVTPFVLLLGAIAVLPLFHFSEHWWESNQNKLLVAGGLGLATLLYYALVHADPIHCHFLGQRVIEHPGGAFSWQLPSAVIANAIFQDFVPFIVLLFSLYTITGGIRIEGDLPAHPLTNTAFLAVGALLASFIGTTGAAMLLIRPLLETNRQRTYVSHTVVFFIFVVCNCGGCLLPLGDPPLFLGYLQGVPFLWTASLWLEWLFVNGVLLVLYFVWDSTRCYPRETPPDVVRDEARVHRLRFGGLWPNLPLLCLVVAAVAFLDPSKELPGTSWHPWLYLREITLLSLVLLSLALGPASVRHGNKFNYGAIIEVAVLFIGIFICMQPALQILHEKGPGLGINTAPRFFWVTGALSSVLDNAPTYLVFLETARALHATGVSTAGNVGVPDNMLAAISLGAVFMGANTYIGNGPNFMVKTIAEKSGVRMPSFFGYMVYSGAFLIPLFGLTTWLFFLK